MFVSCSPVWHEECSLARGYIETFQSIAFDSFFFHNGFNLIDGRSVTFRRHSCSCLSVPTLDVDVSIIDRIGQMCGCPFDLTATYGTIVKHDNGISFTQQ